MMLHLDRLLIFYTAMD